MGFIDEEVLDSADKPDYLPENQKYSFVVEDLVETGKTFWAKCKVVAPTDVAGYKFDIGLAKDPNRSKFAMRSVLSMLRGPCDEKEIRSAEGPELYAKVIGCQYTAIASRVVTDKEGKRKQYPNDVEFETINFDPGAKGESGKVDDTDDIPF